MRLRIAKAGPHIRSYSGTVCAAAVKKLCTQKCALLHIAAEDVVGALQRPYASSAAVTS